MNQESKNEPIHNQTKTHLDSHPRNPRFPLQRQASLRGTTAGALKSLVNLLNLAAKNLRAEGQNARQFGILASTEPALHFSHWPLRSRR